MESWWTSLKADGESSGGHKKMMAMVEQGGGRVNRQSHGNEERSRENGMTILEQEKSINSESKESSSSFSSSPSSYSYSFFPPSIPCGIKHS